MFNQVQLQQFTRETKKFKELFNNCKKVFIISPPRNASSIFSLLLNLNDKFSIYCESCIDDICDEYSLSRMSRMSDLADQSKPAVKDFLVYCKKHKIEYSDAIVYLFSRNKQMSYYMQNDWIIGDKTPYVSGKINFIKYMNNEFDNIYFYGTIKKDLLLTLQSAIRTQSDDTKRDHEIIISDGTKFIEEMTEFIYGLDNYIRLTDSSNIFLYDYFDFVENTGKIIDGIYTTLLGCDNTFTLGIYDVSNHIDRINEILMNKYFGYIKHFVKVNDTGDMIIDSHQLGLLKNLTKTEINYSNGDWMNIFEEVSNDDSVKENISK